MGISGPHKDNEDNVNHAEVSLSPVLGEPTSCLPFPFTSDRQVSFPYAPSPHSPALLPTGLFLSHSYAEGVPLIRLSAMENQRLYLPPLLPQVVKRGKLSLQGPAQTSRDNPGFLLSFCLWPLRFLFFCARLAIYLERCFIKFLHFSFSI